MSERPILHETEDQAVIPASAPQPSPKSPPPAATSRLRRFLKWALVGVLAAYVVLMIAMNVALGTSLVLNGLNSGTPDVQFHYEKAWTLWPGTVHVRNLRMRIEDRNLQAETRVERVVFDVSVLPLFKKTIRLSDVDGSGVVFRMRHRVTAITDENRDNVAAYPPIEGASGPPIFPTDPEPPPLAPDETWRIDFVDGVARAKEIWIQEFRYVGEVEGRGGFMLWPMQEFFLRPSSGTFAPGTVTFGESEPVSNDFSMELLDSRVDTFKVQEVLGPDPLLYTVFHVKLQASLQTDAFLKHYEALPSTKFDGATLQAEVRFDKGHVLAGSSSSFALTGAAVRARELGIGGSLQLSAKTEADDALELGVDATGLAVSIGAWPSTHKAPLWVDSLRARETLHLVPNQAPSLGAGSVHTVVHSKDMAWLADLWPSDFRREGAVKATIDAKRTREGVTTGSFQSTVQNGLLAGKDISASFDGVLKGQFDTNADPRTGMRLHDVTASFPMFTVRTGKLKESTWVKATVPKATLRTTPTAKLHLEGQLQAGDGAIAAVPVEALGTLAGLAAKWLRAPGIAATGVFKLDDKGFDGELQQGQVGAVRARGFVGRHDRRLRGAFDLDTDLVRVGIRLDDTGMSVSPLIGADWLAKQPRR